MYHALLRIRKDGTITGELDLCAWAIATRHEMEVSDFDIERAFEDLDLKWDAAVAIHEKERLAQVPEVVRQRSLA